MTEKELNDLKSEKIRQIKFASIRGIIDSIFEGLRYELKELNKTPVLQLTIFDELVIKISLFYSFIEDENAKKELCEFSLIMKNPVLTEKEKIDIFEKILQKKLQNKCISILNNGDLLKIYISNKINKKVEIKSTQAQAWGGSFFSRRKYTRYELFFVADGFCNIKLNIKILMHSTNDKFNVTDAEKITNLLNLIEKKKLQNFAENFSFALYFSSEIEFSIKHKMTKKTVSRKDFESDEDFVDEIYNQTKFFVENFNFSFPEILETKDKIQFYIERIKENRKILSAISYDDLNVYELQLLIIEYFNLIPNVEVLSLIKLNNDRFHLKIKKDGKELHFLPTVLYCIEDFIAKNRIDFENDEFFNPCSVDEYLKEKFGVEVIFTKVNGDVYKKNHKNLIIEDFYIAVRSLPQKIVKNIIDECGENYKTISEEQRYFALKQGFSNRDYPRENVLVKKIPT